MKLPSWILRFPRVRERLDLDNRGRAEIQRKETPEEIMCVKTGAVKHIGVCCRAGYKFYARGDCP